MESNNAQIMYMLGEIQGDIRSLNKSWEESMARFESLDKKIAELDTKIGLLTSWRDTLMGKLVVIQAVFATIVGFIIKKI